MRHHREVVRDEQIGEAELVAQIGEQIDDRRLHGDVERGDRLVADDEARLGGQRPGDRDALPLAAAELMRIARAIGGAAAAPLSSNSLDPGRPVRAAWPRPNSASGRSIASPTDSRGLSEETDILEHDLRMLAEARRGRMRTPGPDPRRRIRRCPRSAAAAEAPAGRAWICRSRSRRPGRAPRPARSTATRRPPRAPCLRRAPGAAARRRRKAPRGEAARGARNVLLNAGDVRPAHRRARNAGWSAASTARGAGQSPSRSIFQQRAWWPSAAATMALRGSAQPASLNGQRGAEDAASLRLRHARHLAGDGGQPTAAWRRLERGQRGQQALGYRDARAATARRAALPNSTSWLA